jgi:regulator of protease activity HflC (stomatin/prohibitin superfamily)
VELYDVRLQSLKIHVSVMSKEGLTIEVDTITRFTPLIERLGELHKRIGPDYVSKVIQPIITSSVREVVGNYGPEELYASGSAQRAEDAVTKEVTRELAGMPIVIDDFVVERIALPPSINQAIEDKLRHQQSLLAYEFRLKSAEAEIVNRRLDAEGLAAYNQVLGASLTPNLLRWMGIQATQRLAESPNTKVLMFGGPDGLPVILNLEDKNQPAGLQPPGAAGPAVAPLEPPPATPAPAVSEPAEGAPKPKKSAKPPGEGQEKTAPAPTSGSPWEAPFAGQDLRSIQETRRLLKKVMKQFETERPAEAHDPAPPR